MTTQLDIKVGDRVLIEAVIRCPDWRAGHVTVLPPEHALRDSPVAWPRSAIHSILPRKLKVGDRVTAKYWDDGAPPGLILCVHGEEAWVQMEADDESSDAESYPLDSLTVAPKDPSPEELAKAVERLLGAVRSTRDGIDYDVGLSSVAADEIARASLEEFAIVAYVRMTDLETVLSALSTLQSERDAALEALRPFAGVEERWRSELNETPGVGMGDDWATVISPLVRGDFRRAFAALNRTGESDA